jgi:hypothetical protein
MIGMTEAMDSGHTAVKVDSYEEMPKAEMLEMTEILQVLV